MHRDDPTSELLRARGVVILDGGLATTLEALGADLDDPLWSARVLLEQPELLARAHRAFVEAGADVIATATYQATYEGLEARGLSDSEASALLLSAVELALEAARLPRPGRTSRALVAASVGPYGAFRADGSEYRGNYGLDEDELREFHERRFRLLATSAADLVAFETVPDAREAAALVALLETVEECRAWLSFSLSDETCLSDGAPLAELLAELRGRFPLGWSRLLAVGVNCVPPSRLEAALPVLAAASDRPIVAYPNSGESYAVESAGGERGWSGGVEDWIPRAPAWVKAGVRLIGGCCRTTPEDIVRLRERLSS